MTKSVPGTEQTEAYGGRWTLYGAVMQELFTLGLADGDLVVESGNERSQFGDYLLTELGWRGRYLQACGLPDGPDLDSWVPQTGADFFVAFDLLDRLRTPFTLMAMMRLRARKGAVVTVPNPVMGGVRVTPISLDDFELHGWDARALSLRGGVSDSIMAVCRAAGGL